MSNLRRVRSDGKGGLCNGEEVWDDNVTEEVGMNFKGLSAIGSQFIILRNWVTSEGKFFG